MVDEAALADGRVPRLARLLALAIRFEELPDIDRIYQIVQQMLTQRSGGWPLTMFLTHDDQKPFFGGTYFPKEARYGLPAFKDLLLRVADYYAQHAPELRAQIQRGMAEFAIAPDAVARAIAFAIEQPEDVEIGDITLRPTVQG